MISVLDTLVGGKEYTLSHLNFTAGGLYCKRLSLYLHRLHNIKSKQRNAESYWLNFTFINCGVGKTLKVLKLTQQVRIRSVITSNSQIHVYMEII